MTDKHNEFDRRHFIAGALGAAATLGALGADAQQQRGPAEGAAGAAAAPPRSSRSDLVDAAAATATALSARSRRSRLRGDGQDSDRFERRLLSRRPRRAVPDESAQHSVRRRRPRQHVPHQGRPRALPQPLRAQRSLSRAGEGRPDPVPDVPQSGHGRPQRQGPEPQHREHAHHQSPQLSARAQGGQPAVGAEPADARDRRADLHVRRPAAEPNVHGASEARLADRQHGRVRLRVRGPRQRHRDDVRVHAAGQARLDTRRSKCRTSACCTTSPSPRTTSSST